MRRWLWTISNRVVNDQTMKRNAQSSGEITDVSSTDIWPQAASIAVSRFDIDARVNEVT